MSFFKPSSKKQREEANENLFKHSNWSSHFNQLTQDFFSPSNAFQHGITTTITAIAYDPLQSFLAVGTADGHLHLWGSPAVSTSWQNRPAHSIKFLSFKSGSPLICAIDVKNYLTIYNLSRLQDGKPLREFTHSVRSTVTCFDISPAHAHMFLGLEDGTVECFDLERGIIAPYRIRNLWFEQEALYRRSGVPGAPSSRHIPMCTDIKIHPNDLSLILIAHEGGISLYNLKLEKTVRIFELIIPPGAIGSNADPNHPSVFDERRPTVNCICFRPDGLMIAAGYSDGCLAFWSTNDGEAPVLVRTMDRENVFTFDWQEQPDTGISDVAPSSKSANREPIFRLAWSHCPPAAQNNDPNQSNENDLSKDGTKLVILGGLLENDPTGIHVFHYPKYHRNNKTTTEPDGDTRTALKDSVSSVGHSVYLTDEVPEDFLLIPRTSPYLDGTEDPLAILISSTCSRNHEWLNMTDKDNLEFSSRTVQGYTFPPTTDKEPQEYYLPAPFDWTGSRSVVTSKLFNLSEIAYQVLRSSNANISAQLETPHPKYLPLRGGQAGSSNLISASLQEDYHQASKVISEFSHQYRILVTTHLDYKIRFWDFSPMLLLPKQHSSSQFDSLEEQDSTTQYDFDLNTEFPRRLEHLTIDMTSLFQPPSSNKLDFKLAAPIELQLNQESLDLLIILANRDSLLYTFRHQSATSKEMVYPSLMDMPLCLSPAPMFLSPSSPRVDFNSTKSQDSIDKRPLQLLHLGGKPSTSSGKNHDMIALSSSQDCSIASVGFSPTALIKLTGPEAKNTYTSDDQAMDQGGVLYALTDIGFLAIAHPQEEWVKVVDLRKSKLLFNEIIRHESKSKGKNKQNLICSIDWTISPAETDSATLPRLLVGYANGLFNVVTLSPSDMSSIDNWTAVSNGADSFRCDLNHKSGTLDRPISVFIFDSGGNPLSANLTNLRTALSQETRSRTVFEDDPVPSPTPSLHSISIIVFSHSVVVRMNLNGPQLLCRTDVSSEPIILASTISHQGSHALLLIDNKSSCHILSLPKLEPICRTCLPTPIGAGQCGSTSIDCSADVLKQSSLSTIELTSLFFGRDLMYLPELNLHNPEIVTPEPPGAYSSTLSSMATNLTLNIASWFNPGSQSGEASGGGSGMSRVTGAELDAIIAGPLRPEGKKMIPQPPRGNQPRSRSFLLHRPNHGRSRSKESSSKERAASRGSSGVAGAKTQLGQNIDALDERADRLRILNERFDDIAEASNDMLNQAKRIAQQQAARSSFSTGFSSVKSLFK